MTRPHVLVLLATHNGERYIDEQIDSVARQQGVDVSIVASDDASTDRTRTKLDQWSERVLLQQLSAPAVGSGSAHRNFMRLIREAPLGTATHVALSDQDDRWHPDKLERAVDELRRSGADAYSSNVTAWWPDGRQRLIRKSMPQRRWDYLFEAPGPGCTFVLPLHPFIELRRWVDANFDRLQALRIHDHLIYAYARRHAWNWRIDPRPGLLYRQHGLNVLGANSGWRAARQRWQQIRSGEFRNWVLAIGSAVGDRSPVLASLDRLGVADRWYLMTQASECRRERSEAVLLAAFFWLMPGPLQRDASALRE